MSALTAVFLSVIAQAAAADLPTVPAGEAWRAERPKASEAPQPVLPKFERRVLDNGLVLYHAQVEGLPLVSFRLVTLGGATRDPKGKAGLTDLMYGLLEEGAGSRDALAFSDAVADLGASFGSGADRDQAAVSISGLTRVADDMMGLLADAVRRPTLTAKDFARVQSETLATLERRRGSPQGLAFEKIPELIYGAAHPMGHPSTGTLASVAALTLEDIKTHHAKSIGPKHSALIVVGDLDADAAEALAEEHLGDWDAKADAPPKMPAVAASKRKRVLLINKPGAAQTMTLFGRPLFGIGHPDQHALALANKVYGGSFSARLNMSLREAKGYTYGASSQASFRNNVGVFIAYSALRQDATAPGLKEMFDILTRLHAGKEPPKQTELDDAQNGFIRSMSGQFERTSAIASAASALFVYGLPLDHFNTLGPKLMAVDLAAVDAATKKYLDPKNMHILLVGDAAKVKASLQKLKLGRVEVIEP